MYRLGKLNEKIHKREKKGKEEKNLKSEPFAKVEIV